MKQNLLKLFLEDESGVTVIEIVLILVVLIGLVIIFKKSAQFFDSITLRQNNKTKQFYLTGGFICEEMQRKYDDYDVPGFSILLSLLLSGIQLARTQAGRIQAMHAADTGIYSIFAQYDKDLLDSYDLFYLDAGYGSSQVNPSFIVRQMESFMKPTLETSLTRCQIQSCAITGYVLSTDENARSFMGQVSRAVKNQLGTQAISSLRDFLEQTDSTLKNQEEQKNKDYQTWNLMSQKQKNTLPHLRKPIILSPS